MVGVAWGQAGLST